MQRSSTPSRKVATEELLDEVLAEIRDQIKAQMPKRDADVALLEAEFRDVRAEQKRLAKAVALDLPELVTELRHATHPALHRNDIANPAKGETLSRNEVTPKGLEPLFSA